VINRQTYCIVRYIILKMDATIERTREQNAKLNHNHSHTHDHRSTRTALFALLFIFSFSVLCLTLVYYNFPKLDPSERAHLKLPKNIEDAKKLGTVLSIYKDKYFVTVLSGFLVTYVFLQSFAIPGSIFLSILSGFLFPFSLALFLVCLCSAVGASLCYLLSYLVGRRIILKYWPERAAQWSAQVDKHKDHLLNYIIFLRITPFLPNWFINIASPLVDVPLKPFFLGTFFGVAPPSFIAIHAGTTLQKLTSSKSILSWTSVIMLIIFATIAIIPVVLKGKLKEKFN
jgi:uncharacterized membrane protein YdjX (TVP38/TMEM64 family)